jgi:alkylation response protein AidB-like acyl-CoA dehydrogenase
MFPFYSSEDFEIRTTQDHELIRKTVREFMEEEVRKIVEVGESKREIPEEIRRKAADLGLMSIDVPREYGGQGGDMLGTAIVAEEISRIWPSFSTHILIYYMFSYTLLNFGNEEQKRKYVPPVARGEKIPAHANTEPYAGSDVAGIRTYAKRINDSYVINGRKIFITNGDIADYYLVTARTSPPETNQRWKGISVFIIEKGMPGLKVVNRIDTLGLRASHTAELSFEDLKVPSENLVGVEGQGFKYFVETYDYSRVFVAAQALGLAQSALELMVDYTSKREAFNQQLIDFQLIQEKIADITSLVSASRLLTYWAANLFMKGKKDEAIIASSIAKMFSTEGAEKASILAITGQGGYGVSSGGAERLLRDVEIMKIYEGANDIQRLTIAKQIMKRIKGSKL